MSKWEESKMSHPLDWQAGRVYLDTAICLFSYFYFFCFSICFVLFAFLFFTCFFVFMIVFTFICFFNDVIECCYISLRFLSASISFLPQNITQIIQLTISTLHQNFPVMPLSNMFSTPQNLCTPSTSSIHTTYKPIPLLGTTFKTHVKIFKY